jgi:membrane associated rhomboid family serine protease
MNGSGEFDASDVQQMMNNLGLHLRLSFSRPVPRGRRLREMNLERARRAEKELEAKRKRRECHLKQMRELREGAEEEKEGHDGLGSASVAARATSSASLALAMAGEQAVYSMEVAYYKAAEVVVASVDLDVECVESTIKDNLRQYLPWFTILQVCVCFGLWLGYVLQTNLYLVLAEDASVDDSMLVGNFSGVGKYECHIECSYLGDACWGVAFLEGPVTQCKLLSEAPLVQPAQTACREGVLGWELSEKQPRAYGSLLGTIGGLETAYPGQTALQSFSYCEDGFEASIFWRLLSYQFTHLGLWHVGSNCLMLVFFAVPLEGFHGTGLTALMYTMGVVGGGLAWMILDPYEKAQGASGGVYALLGMHLADLALNWKQKKFRYGEFLFLAAMTAFETVCYISSVQEGTSGTAHSVHAGGLVSGLLVGMVLTRSIDRKRWNRGFQAFALLAGAGLVCLSLSCWFSSPFPGIGGGLLSGGKGPLCWIGQVCTNANSTGCDYNIGWQCVACSTRECVEDWYRDEFSFCVKSGDLQTCDGSFAEIVHICQNC